MTDKVQKIKDWISKEQDGLMDAQGNFEYPEHEGAYHILCNLDAYIDSLQEEPVILTEEILKKNGFKLNPRPRYKEPFWSELFTASDGRKYYFKINMEQRVETLMTIEPLATDDEHGHPTCYLPHPKTIQQLEKSLRLFNIKYVIKV